MGREREKNTSNVWDNLDRTEDGSQRVAVRLSRLLYSLEKKKDMVLKCAYNGVSFSVIKQTTRQLSTRLFRLAEHTS